jgi:hypothetical protein
MSVETKGEAKAPQQALPVDVDPELADLPQRTFKMPPVVDNTIVSTPSSFTFYNPSVHSTNVIQKDQRTAT